MKLNIQVYHSFRLLITFFLLLYSFSSFADIRYVSKTGSSTLPYTSWATAADSIMKAINISNSGDTIYVANGEYKELVVMIPGLSLIGAGSDSCIIDTRELIINQPDKSVIIQDESLIENFLIKVYINDEKGTAIYSSGGCIIRNNKTNEGFYGVVVYNIRQKNAFIYQNTLINNRMGIRVFNSNSIIRGNSILGGIKQWRAIYLDEFEHYTAVIDSNLIITSENGIIRWNNYSEITNNIFIFQGTGWENGIYGGDTSLIYNNLLIAENLQFGIANSLTSFCYNNYVFGEYRYGAINGRTNSIIENNVVTGGSKGITKVTDNPIVRYNDAWNNGINYEFPVDSTNISVDPMVVNDDSTKGKLDFHLQMFSPLIDAGNPAILDKDSSRSDIGLYGGPYGESYPYIDYPPRTPRNFTALVDSEQIFLSWNKNTEKDFSFYRLYRDTVSGFPVDSSRLISEQRDTFFIQIPPTGEIRLYYKLTSVDKQGNQSAPTEELSVVISSISGEPAVVSNYILYQNYPNPFNPSTKIAYQLKENGYVKLYVYSITGELVETLVNRYQQRGFYEVEFMGRSSGEDTFLDKVAGGIYIYSIMIRGDKDTPVFTDSKKMIYLK